MGYLRTIKWAVVIYATMFFLSSGLIRYGVADHPVAWVFQLAGLFAVVSTAARTVRVGTALDMLAHSIPWAISVALIDLIYAAPFFGWEMYNDWRIWFGYALVAFIPILSVKWPPRHDENR